LNETDRNWNLHDQNSQHNLFIPRREKASSPTTASSPQLAVPIAWISEQASIALDLAKAVRQVKWQTIQVRHARSWRQS
jgi:hypothetical protein